MCHVAQRVEASSWWIVIGISFMVRRVVVRRCKRRRRRSTLERPGWVLASRRPASGGQLGALTALLGLVLIGGIALAWPWLTEDAPRAVVAGLALVQAQLADWLRLLVARLPRFH